MTTTPDTQPTGPSPANRGLPPVPSRFVHTGMVSDVSAVVRVSVHTGDFCLIDGPVGIGKTTAVVEAARQLKSKAVYVNMVGTDSTRQQMDAIWTGMTGTESAKTAPEIRKDIIATLQRTTIILLIDDAHHVHRKGLTAILAIWNHLHTTRGKGTPIVLCGNGLRAHLRQTLPEMHSRAPVTYPATPLAGKVLIDTIMAMEPRIAGTDRDTIRDINKRYFKGEIRRWNQFFDLLDIVRVETDPSPLNHDEADTILSMMTCGPGSSSGINGRRRTS